MGNRINDGNTDGILIQVRRSNLSLDETKIQTEKLDFGEIIYLNNTTVPNYTGKVAKAPRLVIGDVDTDNTVPNEYAIRLVRQTIVDNAIYVNYDSSDTAKAKPHLIDADEQLVKDLRVNGDVYVGANTLNANGYKLARQDSLAPERTSTTYSAGDLTYYENKLYYYDNGAWKATTLQDYIGKFGGKIDGINLKPGDVSNMTEGLAEMRGKIAQITIPTKTSHLQNDGTGVVGDDRRFLLGAFIVMSGANGATPNITETPENKYKFWIDTQGNGIGGLKYYNGSSWVTVPVRWS